MLIRENTDKYLDIKLDYDFIENNKYNHDIAYSDSDAKVCKKLKNTIQQNYNKDYSRFGLYCLSKFVSFNEAKKLYDQKYILDFSNIETYEGYNHTLYYSFNHIEYSNNIKFDDLINKFILYKLYEYKYNDDTLDVDFDKSLLNYNDFKEINYFNRNKNLKEILGPNLYLVIKWWIKQDKLTIIDKGNYFMFFFNNQKHFHLCRTDDNDIYFREKDFDRAIDIIFKKLL